MMSSPLEPVAAAPARFITTRWSLVVSAGAEAKGESGQALEELCKLYWQPLYSFIRGRGNSVEDAEDLLQGFIAHLLENETLSKADRQRGRFRSFLLGCLQLYLANERNKAQALKRGGGRRILSVDVEEIEKSIALELADDLTPEKIFEMRWVMTVIDLTMERMRDWYGSRAKLQLFEQLGDHLTGAKPQQPYRRIADDLGMTESAVKSAAHEMRGRFTKLVREQIAETVAKPEEVENEIQELFAVFDN